MIVGWVVVVVCLGYAVVPAVVEACRGEVPQAPPRRVPLQVSLVRVLDDGPYDWAREVDG